MPDPEPFEEVICIVQKPVIVGITDMDLYEVVLKNDRKPAMLLCHKVPALAVGQEFTAQFITNHIDGKYLLQSPIYERDNGKLVLRREFEPPSIPGGGILIPFPTREITDND